MAETYTLTLSSGVEYPYQLLRSKRAKYVRIKLSQQGKLTVTLPRFNKENSAHDFIRAKRKWIEKNLSNIPCQTQNQLPKTLDLKLLNEVWKVEYTDTSSTEKESLQIKECDDFTLEIHGHKQLLTDSIIVRKIINQWCKIKARAIFNEMLEELAELHGFHYHRLSIRAQKTRWGSCSQKKNINLNCKLLFMPEAVVKYVFIHELCHTVEMNHSSRFWALVADCDPQFQLHKKQLKSLEKELVI